MLALRHAARRAPSSLSLPSRHPHSPLRAAMSTASSSDKKFYILQYQYTPDILEKRDPFRSEHLARAKALKVEGKLLMAGAFVDPTDAAVFIFSTADKRDINEFVQNDPYVQNNLVVAHTIREWNVAV
uniref:YCII-related domain-containing protein n=1 Tax=Globisporangium ultimum (strain ATCC 200006 / CBS 805.95 / DAOM BR144) TaxID=431595 RepID=K3X2K9_GLOUD